MTSKAWVARIVLWVWQLPVQVLIWLFYILPLWWVSKDFSLESWGGWFGDPAIFRLRSKKSWYARAWRYFYGCTMPSAVILDEDNLAKEGFDRTKCLRHEFWHVLQWRLLGVFFLVIYGLSAVNCWLREKDNSTQNILELGAYGHEDKNWLPAPWWTGGLSLDGR